MGSVRAMVLGLVAGAGIVVASPVGAALLTFEGFPASTNLGGVPGNAASVLTTQLGGSDGIVFGRTGVSAGVAVIENNSAAFSDPNSISGLDASGQLTMSVAGDMYFNFVDPGNPAAPATTDLLSFRIGDDGGDTDSWTIRAYDLSDSVIDTQMLSGADHQLYTLALTGIHRIWIENTTGTSAGFGVDNLSYNTPTGNGPPSSVPEPAALALLGIALAGLGFSRRRKLH